MPNLQHSAMPNFIKENVSLKAFNTFRFEAKARYFTIIHTVDELTEALKWANTYSIAINMLGEVVTYFSK